MNFASLLVLVIGFLAVGGSLVALFLVKGTKKYMLAGVSVPWLLLIPALTSFESSRRIINAFREMALDGSGGIVVVATPLREATEIAIIGERVLLASLLLLFLSVVFQLVRKAPTSESDGAADWFRRAVLLGGAVFMLIFGAALSEFSLRSRALPLVVALPVPNGKADVVALPHTLRAWEHLRFDDEDTEIGGVTAEISRTFVLVSGASMVLAPGAIALGIVSLVLLLTGTFAESDLLSMLAVLLFGGALFALTTTRNHGFLDELDAAVGTTATGENQTNIR